MLPDYYTVFGLDISATKEQIKKRYRELAKKFHPDVNRSPDATSKMQEILEAYYILNDEEARSLYNKEYIKAYQNTHYTNNEQGERYQSTKAETTNEDIYEQPTIDPDLDKWIRNAREQSAEYLKRFIFETKGVAKSGCTYYFKALAYCILAFIILVIILNIIGSLR